MPAKPALVILAAGASRRLGECKALAAITPHNPLELLSRAGASFDDGAALVVTGADHEAIARALPAGLEIAFNPHWEKGRTSGVLLASSLREDRDLCIAPVDVPLVSRAVFERLLEAWLASHSPARGWLAPRLRSGAGDASEKSAYGHPVIVGRELLARARASELDPRAPLRTLREGADPRFSIDVDDRAVLDDLDAPEDLVRLRARARERSG